MRAKDTLKRWRIIGPFPFYGIGGLFLLYCSLGLVYGLIHFVHETQAPGSFRGYWYYDSPISVLLIVFIVYCRRPQLLALSRWRPRWIDFGVGIPAGLLVPLIAWLAFRDPVNSLRLYLLRPTSLIPFVCLTPVLEEIFCRGIFVRSVESYWPRICTVVFVAAVIASVHSSFWMDLPAQLLLSSVYVALGNSLPASITAHFANNAAVFLFATSPLVKWHAYIYSLWK